MSKYKTAFLYVLFACVATAMNFIAQEVVFQALSPSFGFALSVLAGTVVGLFVKYFLDRKWIFRSSESGKKGLEFFLYSLTGVFTTFVFWLLEAFFYFVFQNAEMRYVGGAIGLALGYYIKYRLDRRFVFSRPT